MHNSGFAKISTAVALVLALMTLEHACFSAEGGRVPVIPAEQTQFARKLVDALDSDSFLVRQKARDSLMKLGRGAIDALEYGSKSESSEVRLRSTELLIALRGRGLLGIGMMLPQLNAMPGWGAGVSMAVPGLPAEQAGLQSGDIIVSINGVPIPDNNELQHIVFEAGPARVLDVVVERGSEKEKLHLPVLLTVNLNPPANPSVAPPVSLEAELPESEIKGRAEARAEQIRNGGFGAFVVMNGTIVQNSVEPQPANPSQPIDSHQLEAEFEAARAEARREQGDAERPAKK